MSDAAEDGPARELSPEEAARLAEIETQVEGRLDELFPDNQADQEQLMRMGVVTEAAIEFVRRILYATPRSADQQSAIRNVRVALHQACDAIMLDGKG